MLKIGQFKERECDRRETVRYFRFVKMEGDRIGSKSCLMAVSPPLAICVELYDGVITGLIIEATIFSTI